MIVGLVALFTKSLRGLLGEIRGWADCFGTSEVEWCCVRGHSREFLAVDRSFAGADPLWWRVLCDGYFVRKKLPVEEDSVVTAFPHQQGCIRRSRGSVLAKHDLPRPDHCA